MATNSKEARVIGDFFKVLECPVCLELMTDRVLLCVEGHSVCSTCGQNLEICPTCKDSFSRSRNFSLRLVIQNIVFPCKNAPFGCEEMSLLAERKKHEVACPYQQYECLPFNSCSWEGKKVDFLEHIQEQHYDFVFIGEDLDLTTYIDFSLNARETKIISVYGEVFWVKVLWDSKKESRYLSVHYLGPDKDSSKYMYEVSYISIFTAHKSVFCTYTHPASVDIYDLIKRNECSVVSKYIAQHFIENDSLLYNVKIYTAYI